MELMNTRKSKKAKNKKRQNEKRKSNATVVRTRPLFQTNFLHA